MGRYLASALTLLVLMTSPASAVVIDDFTLPMDMSQTSASGGGLIETLGPRQAALTRQLIGRAPDSGSGDVGALRVDGGQPGTITGRLGDGESASILYDFGTAGFDFQLHHTLLLVGFTKTGGDANQATIRALVDGVQFGAVEWEGLNAPGLRLTAAPSMGRFLELRFTAPDATGGDGDPPGGDPMSGSLAFSFTGSAVVSTPEPGSLLLLASLSVVAGVRHRKRRLDT